ncbi:hypothetical protein GCM10010319_28090 [Streptomyces blastmyceticus]|uniref:Uncharacterized protein n=1 Tax=Streptomyces blastmyceticus TaxID=68180 RepID=A0ABN0WXP5_9ACTN
MEFEIRANAISAGNGAGDDQAMRRAGTPGAFAGFPHEVPLSAVLSARTAVRRFRSPKTGHDLRQDRAGAGRKMTFTG